MRRHVAAFPLILCSDKVQFNAYYCEGADNQRHLWCVDFGKVGNTETIWRKIFCVQVKLPNEINTKCIYFNYTDSSFFPSYLLITFLLLMDFYLSILQDWDLNCVDHYFITIPSSVYCQLLPIFFGKACLIGLSLV